jgi:abelson tyrosine-protein kinase 1
MSSITVVGTLDAPDYAQYVSHSHPDGQLHFNVYASPGVGNFWGSFTRDTQLSPQNQGGPNYVEATVPSVFAEKVSTIRPAAAWNSVLLARLRFKPDVDQPTSR